MALRARIAHVRLGHAAHAFRYTADYVLLDPDGSRGPLLFSRNAFNLCSVHDRDHGGARGRGRGASWVRDMLHEHGVPEVDEIAIRLLTQPRFLGCWFTPVSFWFAFRGEALVAAIAEVNNTFGHRHCYLSANPGFAPITSGDEPAVRKVFHVSPFLDIAGKYRFRYALDRRKVAVRIVQDDGGPKLIATMVGELRPLRNRDIALGLVRRPLGPLRVLALIYWNALRLKLKGATYRPCPDPPEQEMTT
jgi:uncharacterized protein